MTVEHDNRCPICGVKINTCPVCGSTSIETIDAFGDLFMFRCENQQYLSEFYRRGWYGIPLNITDKNGNPIGTQISAEDLEK
jgi:hypothetical protein